MRSGRWRYLASTGFRSGCLARALDSRPQGATVECAETERWRARLNRYRLSSISGPLPALLDLRHTDRSGGDLHHPCRALRRRDRVAVLAKAFDVQRDPRSYLSDCLGAGRHASGQVGHLGGVVHRCLLDYDRVFHLHPYFFNPKDSPDSPCSVCPGRCDSPTGRRHRDPCPVPNCTCPKGQ